MYYNIFMICNICPRKCNIDRSQSVGFCGANNTLKVAKYMVHNWEEPIISGSNGSGAIFFSHCNLKCEYCQNYEISWQGLGKQVGIDELIDIFKELENKGVHNINLVTPSHYSEQIIKALSIYTPKVPIVWNSNGYESVETIARLKDLVDIYLVDMKYMDDELGGKLSHAKDYSLICAQAILQMRKNQPKDIIENGIMQKGVIVRHLVLPNEVDNSFKVLEWISNNLGKDCYVSVMGQYTPCYKAKEITKYNRPLNPIEYKRVINKLNQLGFNNGFYQELSSADSCFIPNFQQFND